MEKLENGSVAEDQPEMNYKGWKAMPYIIGNETCEKLGTLGTAANLLVYLTTVFHIKSVDAVTINNVFHGTTNIAPLAGAFLSDTYLGRYTTLAYASIFSLVGMVIMVLTAAVAEFHPRRCNQQADSSKCEGASAGQLAVLFSSFVFLVLGAGGIRSCNFSFGADQFNPNTDSGRRGINSFFNWYYFTFTTAMMISVTFIIYIQSNINWALGFAIPALLMLFSCVFFFAGTRIYVKVKPEGSPFTGILRVFVAAFRKRGLKLDDHRDNNQKFLFDPPHLSSLVSKLPYTDQLRFLDKAAVKTSDDKIMPDGLAAEDPWRLCTLQQVEQVKCLLRIIPIWCSGVIFYVALVQQSSFVVLQALQSERHLVSSFQIPAASISVVTMLTLTIWIPIYDRIVVPLLRLITHKEEGITVLQRMGVGIFLTIVAMLVSARIEQRRRSAASTGSEISAMSCLWFIPQLMLMGLAEGFNLIGQVEFYYKQFPENMRSIAGGLLFLGLGVSNYLSGFMVTIVHKSVGTDGKSSWLTADLNKGRLDLFYFMIAIIGALNLICFIVFAKWYRYKGIDQNQSSKCSMEK